MHKPKCPHGYEIKDTHNSPVIDFECWACDNRSTCYKYWQNLHSIEEHQAYQVGFETGAEAQKWGDLCIEPYLYDCPYPDDSEPASVWYQGVLDGSADMYNKMEQSLCDSGDDDNDSEID
jgi:hypothetical protein